MNITRSRKQNRYYFKCIVLLLGNELGYHKYEMHELLTNRFIAERSKELNTKEFNQYCEQIRIWSLQDLGIRIPLPNEC